MRAQPVSPAALRWYANLCPWPELGGYTPYVIRAATIVVSEIAAAFSPRAEA